MKNRLSKNRLHFFCLLAALVLSLIPSARAQQVVAPTKKILAPLNNWERGSWGSQFEAWFAAMKTAGYTVDVVSQEGKAPDIDARQMLEGYDAVAFTSGSNFLIDPKFQNALEEFVRQGGGLIFILSGNAGPWVNAPINFMLPTTFTDAGPGWGAGNANFQMRAGEPKEHPINKGVDWKSAPPLEWVSDVSAAPDSELWRGTLQVVEPRESLTKSLLNNNWNEVLSADDTERSPLALVGQYGRGRVFVWNGFFGKRDGGESPFVKWNGFAPLWKNALDWTSGAGKVLASESAVWVAGEENADHYKGDGWEFSRVLSYNFPDAGMSRAQSAAGANAALVLRNEDANGASLSTLAAANKPLLVCDPKTFSGALKQSSPLSETNAAPVAREAMTLGEAVKIPPAPQTAQVAIAPLQVLADAAIAAPQEWKVRATNSVTFTRDIEDKWFGAGFDDAQWQSRALGKMTQKIGGKDAAYTGAIWYRTKINLPAQLPENAVWTFAAAEPGLYGYALRAWSDGKEIEVENLSKPNIQTGPWALRLSQFKPGAHELTLRFYNAGGGNYWTGSRLAYANFGLASATAEARAKTEWKWWADAQSQPDAAPRRGASKLPEDAPLLFYDRASGDKDFKIVFNVDAAATQSTPILFFDEPGLIHRVRVNGTWIERIPNGLWDGITGGNTTAFALNRVLKAGENTLEFHPDFEHLREMDVPVAEGVLMRCALPRLEWTGELQTLVAVDPSLAPYLPNRLFKPGQTLAAAPGAQVLLKWSDGRPALVKKNNVLAWTSEVIEQFNTPNPNRTNKWQMSWESSGYWHQEAQDGIPRPDSLLWENTSPLLAVLLSRELAPNNPRFASVKRRGNERALEVLISNPGAAREAILSYRLFDWQGAILESKTQSLQLKAGENSVTIAVPRSPFLGGNWKPEYSLRASLRSADGATGLAEIEKMIKISPTVRVAIQTDDAQERAKTGRIPDRIKDDPNFRGRDLWWPLLDHDGGSTVYLDGETATVSVTLSNQTDEAQSVPVVIELSAPCKNKIEKTEIQTVTLAPRAKKTITLQNPLHGVFEPYLVRVVADGIQTTRPLYSVQPWKKTAHVDRVPSFQGMSFGLNEPHHAIQQPDAIVPLNQGSDYQYGSPNYAHREMHDWWTENRTGTIGNGGGNNGFTGYAQGFGWGPFFQSRWEDKGYDGAMTTDQISVLPDGRPVMHYIAEGLKRQQRGPSRNEVIDFWVNYQVSFNPNTLPAFREWLAIKYPTRVSEFHPQTLKDAETLVQQKFFNEWNEWQQRVIVGGWGAIREAAPAPSTFWGQAEHAILAADGMSTPALGGEVSRFGARPNGQAAAPEVVKFLGEKLYSASDADSGTNRMGLGWRYRSFGETSATAIAPSTHFNVSAERHQYFHNEQRMQNRGNATAESYRPFMFETAWAASVRPDGSLRTPVDMPSSEPFPGPSGGQIGTRFGNTLFNQTYRLMNVIEPQRALGLLWVTYLARGREGDEFSSRTIYETMRNAGVPLSAMIAPEYLKVAPKTGASGVLYLLPTRLEANEIVALKELVAAKFPVVCLASPQSKDAKAQLPSGVTIIDLPAEWTSEKLRNEAMNWPMEDVRDTAKRINDATGAVLNASEGVAIYGFGAQKKVFVIVQNMWPQARSVDVEVDAKSSGLAGAANAVNLNDNTPLKASTQAGKIKVSVPLAPWDAALVLLSP